ncbi:MAG: MFS transporter [Thermoanaerobaculia bacterium]|nr:MFS transporter [Thermoanaerobaculia bacterium]
MDSSNDRSIVGLTMIAHAMVHTYELSIPILMTLWLEEFALSNAVLGGIVAVGYGLFGLGAVPGGVLSDRFGSKRLIMGCLAGMGGAFLLLSTAQGLWMITAALVLWGAAASVYHPAGLALISKGVVRRGRAFAWHGMAGNIGIALGPLATTVALIVFDWRTVSLLLVVPAVVALVIAARLRFDEHAGLDADEQAATQDAADWSTIVDRSRRLFVPSFLIVFGIVMLSGLYYRGALTFLPELLGDMATLPAMALGELTLESGRYVYVGLLLIGVFGQYVGGWLTDKVSLSRPMATRRSRCTGCPMRKKISRICRVRPSDSTTFHQLLLRLGRRPLTRNGYTSAPARRRPSITMPSFKRCSASGAGEPLTLTS